MDEGEVGVCGEGGAVEQNEPDVDAELGLLGGEVVSEVDIWLGRF